MIIWDKLTVQNSNGTAQITADKESLGSLEVSGTTQLNTITYSGTPTASFYNATIANILNLGGSNNIVCGTVAYPSLNGWSETKVISYKNCDFGNRLGLKFTGAHVNFYLELGPDIAPMSNGTGVFQRIRSYNSSNTAALAGIALRLDTIDGNTSVLDIRDWDNSTYTFLRAGTIISNARVEATTFNATSDRRLKTNIQPWQSNNSILDLPIYSFDFISDRSHHIGCLAQDLQQICPEIVHENTEGYLQIEESKIVYLLLQEVKQLKQTVMQLEQKHGTIS